MSEHTDTERLDWLIANKADVEAPEIPDSRTWVVYTDKQPFGQGAGCHLDLRKAIDEAMRRAP